MSEKCLTKERGRYNLQSKKEVDMSEVQTAFPYDPSRISKIKTIERHKWNPDKKHIYWKMVTTSGLFRNYFDTRMSAQQWFTPMY